MENSNIQKEQKFLSLLQETLKQARGNGGRISRDEIEEISLPFLWKRASSSRWKDI